MALPKPQLARKTGVFQIRNLSTGLVLDLPNTVDSGSESRSGTVYREEIEGVDGAVRTRSSTLGPIDISLSGVLTRFEEVELFKRIVGLKEVQLRKNTENIVYDEDYEPIVDTNNEEVTFPLTAILNAEVSGYRIKEVIIDKLWEFELSLSSTQHFWLRGQQFTTPVNPTEIENTGDFIVFPRISVVGGVGGATQVSVSLNGGLAEFTGTINEGETLLVDCERIAASLEGQGVLNSMSNEFYTNRPFLLPGTNTPSISVTGAADVSFIFTERLV